MSKRRKYDIKNKRSFIIIVILSVLVVAIFSLFIYKYSKASKIEYIIESGSILQDVDKNYLTIDDDAKLKIRWNDNYYLIYNDEKITLGKKVIVYNTITGGMKLYGNFYEISSNGKILENKNETVLANTTDSKFYKIDDREYLLVSNKIYSEDYSIEASNYLLVELDKAGNAKLSNNKINLKTISPTTLVTADYSFDINNEILNFGDFEIDLKKIIGSTNEYKEIEVKPENDNNDNNNDTGNNNNIPNNVPNNNQGNGNAGTGVTPEVGDVVNKNETGDIIDVEDLMDKVKMTSIIRVVEGLTEIDIDYVIYDPYNEYGNVYVEVTGNGKLETIYLSKNDTHVTLDNLAANTEYKLDFIYTTLKVDEETSEEEYVPYTFEHLDLKTKLPKYSIGVHKISKVSNTLTYKVNLQSGFSISLVNVNLTFDHKVVDPETGAESIVKADLNGSVPVTGIGGNSVYGTFDISGYNIEADTILSLTVKSVLNGEVEIPINAPYTFRFGR